MGARSCRWVTGTGQGEGAAAARGPAEERRKDPAPGLQTRARPESPEGLLKQMGAPPPVFVIQQIWMGLWMGPEDLLFWQVPR